jgi:hypothetical protein
MRIFVPDLDLNEPLSNYQQFISLLGELETGVHYLSTTEPGKYTEKLKSELRKADLVWVCKEKITAFDDEGDDLIVDAITNGKPALFTVSGIMTRRANRKINHMLSPFSIEYSLFKVFDPVEYSGNDRDVIFRESDGSLKNHEIFKNVGQVLVSSPTHLYVSGETERLMVGNTTVKVATPGDKIYEVGGRNITCGALYHEKSLVFVVGGNVFYDEYVDVSDRRHPGISANVDFAKSVIEYLRG